MVSVSHEARPARAGAESVPIILIGALLAAAMAFLYSPLWEACWKEWWREESAYSHGVLIPPLALLMVWHRRDELARRWVSARPALTGLALVLLGLALQLVARWAVSTMLSWAAFLLVVTGGIAFVAGWSVTRHLLPPVLFLTFMVPVSAMLTQPFVFGAQMVSTKVAMGFLRLMGFQAHQLGTIIRLENYTLQVALPCSGFKTLIALSAFAACFVYMLRGSLPKKLLLFGTATVLSLLVNGLRISLVGVTGELIGSAQASWVHDNGGLPVAALALGGLFLMARMLKCPLAAPVSPLTAASTGAVKTRRELFPILTVLIGATALLAARLPTIQSEARADSQPAARLPVHLGQWEGTDEPVGADVEKALPTAHILSRRYQSASGSADVTIVSGSDATALHDPHDCLAGEGWHFLKDRPLTVDLGAPGGPIQIRDVWMVKGQIEARMWYWYAVGSDLYDNTLRARLGLFRVRIVEGRGRRAEFVRLIVGSESGEKQTTTMLTDIARQVAARSN